MNFAAINSCAACYDGFYKEYNLLLCVGESTVPSKWACYDLARREWFEMGPAKSAVSEKNMDLKIRWNHLKKLEKLFSYPGRPVLFDSLEKFFMDQGLRSPLKCCPNSPGPVQAPGSTAISVLGHIKFPNSFLS